MLDPEVEGILLVGSELNIRLPDPFRLHLPGSPRDDAILDQLAVKREPLTGGGLRGDPELGRVIEHVVKLPRRDVVDSPITENLFIVSRPIGFL